MPYTFPLIDYKEFTKQGYFPAGLPPFFSTETLADFYNIERNRSRVLANRERHVTNSTNFSFPKNYKMRRFGKIVNPISHLKLCNLLVRQRNFISGQINSSNFSLSKPGLFSRNIANSKYLGVSSSRYFEPAYKHSQLTEVRLRHAISYRYLLTLDIGSFYSNMYVHSFSWAACTKEIAKEVWRGSNSNPNYGPAIEFENAIKSIQDKETRGIPLGHDFAFIVAESVLSGLDKIIEDNISTNYEYKIVRHVDDYEIYFNHMPQALHVQDVIRSIFEDYGFHLNEEKQSLSSFPFEIQETWVDDLSSVNLPANRDDYKKFLNIIIRKANKYFTEDKNDRAVKYILQVLRPHKDKSGLAVLLDIADQNWLDLEMTLAYLLKLDFRNINIMYDIIKYHRRGDAGRTINNICTVVLDYTKAIRPDYCYEVSWITWIIDEFWGDFSGIGSFRDTLDAFSLNIIKSGSPIAVLSILRLLNQHGLLSAKQSQFSKILRHRYGIDGRKNTANQQIFIDRLLSTSDWLLIYTLCEKNWCSFDPAWLGAGYSDFRNAGVSFLKGNVSLATQDLEMGISIAGMGGFASISYN